MMIGETLKTVERADEDVGKFHFKLCSSIEELDLLEDQLSRHSDRKKQLVSSMCPEINSFLYQNIVNLIVAPQ